MGAPVVENRRHPRKTSRRRKGRGRLVLWQAQGLCGLHTLHQLLADFNAFQVTSKAPARSSSELGRPVGGGREGADSFFGRLKACVDVTPYINSWLISTHFR